MPFTSLRAALCALAIVTTMLVPASASARRLSAFTGDVHGVVTDSATGAPLNSAQVSIMHGTQIVQNVLTDAFGRFRAHNIPAGSYTLVVRYIGYAAKNTPLTVATDDVRADVQLKAQVMQLEGVTVEAAPPVAVDTRSGDQTFVKEEAHAAPTTTTSQVIQQSVAGAARAPTGEVHIRGQHAEFTYYVDGVPVPAGVSGSLNELFDPAIVNSINFRTGGWDAEFGNKNAAVVEVTTRVPAGGFHATASGFAGAFNTNGEGLSASTNSGPWGFFGSFSHQATDMRREPVMFDTMTFKPYNLHNHGDDVFGFGKIQYTPSAANVVNLEANWSRTKFQVPFDTAGGVQADDNQQDINAFVNLGWRHRFNVESGAHAEEMRGGELFAGFFYRHGSLTYTPGASDDPQFVFFPDTVAYNLREDRSFNTVGTKLDYTYRLSEKFEFKAGTLVQRTSGHEDFSTVSASGASGPGSNSDLTGHDIGVYAQTAWAPSEHFELRTGVRYDVHDAPFAGTTTQASPRIRLNFFASPATTLYVFYGRLFVPTNVEDLRAITSSAQGGEVAQPTLPERDHFYEAGFLHRFPVGVVTKFAAYYKQSSPAIDDNTVPGSAIVTSVNIEQVRVTGIESVLEIRPNGPFSGNVNVAVTHAYGYGAITGGFFPAEPPGGKFDLDHDQRLSASAGLTYSNGGFFASASEIYGSGLTNGVDPSDCGCAYGTSLLDFNKGIKVAPNYITSASAGYAFRVRDTSVRPEIFIDNLFDKAYLLKGAFFSGASVGRPRTVQVRMNVGF